MNHVDRLLSFIALCHNNAAPVASMEAADPSTIIPETIAQELRAFYQVA